MGDQHWLIRFDFPNRTGWAKCGLLGTSRFAWQVRAASRFKSPEIATRALTTEYDTLRKYAVIVEVS